MSLWRWHWLNHKVPLRWRFHLVHHENDPHAPEARRVLAA